MYCVLQVLRAKNVSVYISMFFFFDFVRTLIYTGVDYKKLLPDTFKLSYFSIKRALLLVVIVAEEEGGS